MSDVNETASALAETTGAATVAAELAAATAPPAASPGPRTTVLPRVDASAPPAKVVLESRLRFEHVERLGEGGNGEVLSARDHDIGRTVAIKRLRGPRTPQALARFVQEIRTTGQLEHPNIVPVHDVGVDEEGEYYFVMKQVRGETLESIIARLAAGDPEAHRRYTFEARVALFRSLLGAVAFAHSKGILHRDLKPSNVMIGAFGEVLLMDWGIARLPRELAGEEHGGEEGGTDPSTGLRTQAGAILGTPLYMSPEQARGEPLTERSEVYSLCVLFHELLTLRHYLADRKGLPAILEGVQRHDAPSASSVLSPHQRRVPWELTWFLKAGLAKDPAARFPSVAAMLERLERRAAGYIPIQCPVTFLKRVTNAVGHLLDRRGTLVIWSLSALLLGGFALAWLLLR